MVVVLAPTVPVLQACFLLQPVFLSHHSSYLRRGQELNSFPLLFCNSSLPQHSNGQYDPTKAFLFFALTNSRELYAV